MKQVRSGCRRALDCAAPTGCLRALLGPSVWGPLASCAVGVVVVVLRAAAGSSERGRLRVC